MVGKMEVVSDILQTVLGDNLWAVAGAGLAAFLASVLSGMAGYGAGLILPVFIAPLVGVEYVVPVLAVALVFNNAGRVLAFRRDIDWTRVRRILIVAAPMSALGAYGYAVSGNCPASLPTSRFRRDRIAADWPRSVASTALG